MRGWWSEISNSIKKPSNRVKIEIFEGIGITEDEIKHLKYTEKIKISSAQYKNHEGKIFLF